MFFDRRDPTKNAALKHSASFSDLRFERAHLFFSLAGCQLTHSGSRNGQTNASPIRSTDR